MPDVYPKGRKNGRTGLSQMVKARIAGLALLLVAAGCGPLQIRMPAFLRPGAEPGVAGPAGQTIDATVVLPALGTVTAEPALRGTILRVDTVAPSQGYSAAELRPVASPEPGVLAFELRAVPPPVEAGAGVAVGPAQTRLITAGVFLSTRALRDVTAARVVAAGEGRTVPLR